MATTANLTPVDARSSAANRTTLGSTALIGLGLLLVFVGALAVDSSLGSDSATAPEIRRYAAENATKLQLSAVVTIAGAVLFTGFVAGLAQLVRQARRESIVPYTLLLCGAMVAVQQLFHGAAVSIFAFPHEMEGVTDTARVTFYDYTELSEWIGAFVRSGPGVVVIASFSYVALRHRLVARSVCWVGLLLATLAVSQVAAVALPFLDIDGAALIVLFGWWLWPLLVGCALGVRWLRTR